MADNNREIGDLNGFSSPTAFTRDALSDVPNEPGVHVVWDHDGEIAYIGQTSQQRTRLLQHLSGDREASVLHKYVGELLDEQLGRTATRDEIRDWLKQCRFAWKSDSDRQGLKATLIETYSPRFNRNRPTTPAEPSPTTEDVWDEFTFWARYFITPKEFDANERDYKLALGQLFSSARDSVIADNDDWQTDLAKAFNSPDNNLLRWNQRDDYLEWVTTSPDQAIQSLKAIWEEPDVDKAVEQWATDTPKEAVSGPGTRVMFASLLLLGVDPTTTPPFKPSVLDDGYRLVGEPLGERRDEAGRYRVALDFFDRIIEEARDRGLELRDRLDAQSVLWTILNAELTDPELTARLDAFRGSKSVTVWWVNQGQTYAQELEGGYVWAPQRTKKGRVLGHWLNVSKIRKGDVVVHYANGAIRAVSEAKKNGQEAVKPDELGEAWEREGYRCEVRYFELDEPIELAEIPEAARVDATGPFNRHGGVNQGYLYRISEDFKDLLVEQFSDRWPPGSPWEPFTGSYWVFQGNPERWDFDEGLHEYIEIQKGDWSLAQHREDVADGDLVAIWKSGPDAGVYALATVEGEPFERSEEESFTDSPTEMAIGLTDFKTVDPPLRRSELIEDPVLKDMDVIRIRQGTNFRVTDDQWRRLMVLIEGVEPPSVPPETAGLTGVVQSVADELRSAGLSFGSNHDSFVQAFVVSLATKGFVLLTGLSGSGKTRLAIAFGEWLGSDRFLVVPVRPDWTGPDQLLGFEDGLSERVDGRLSWQVPPTLEFMLRASSDPLNPYLLVLDEMNLAHVERYFADVLSGMESRVGVLPNLKLGDSGEWRRALDGPKRLPFPRNLLVAGTVNIDETTYMFSPKVLDRANTLEFRVSTDDLVSSGAIGSISPGPDELIHAFLASATSTAPEWAGREGMAASLRELHRILSTHDREFGHRVLHESLRFGALLADAGEPDALQALDLQIMQKILPRVHGSIRQVGEVLEQLGAWCFSGPGVPVPDSFDPMDPPEGDARLPISFDKIRRMTRRLRANHFVSFAE